MFINLLIASVAEPESAQEIGLGVALCYNVETIFMGFYGVRLKKNVVSVAASCVFHTINMLILGYPPNCLYLGGWVT